MHLGKTLAATLLTTALGISALAAQDYRHNAKPATHRSFRREEGSKQKAARATAKARRQQMKRQRTSHRAN